MPVKTIFKIASLFSILALTIPFLVTAQTVAPGAATHSDNLTTADIIQRMREAYANSRSYSDTGLVKTVFIYPDRRRTVEKPFKTAFIRPDQFRFEYREKAPIFGERRFIIFRKGKELQIHSDLKLGLKLDSLDSAVAAATGISGGSAIRVPAMLLPSEIKSRRAIRFNKPKRIDDDRID